MLGRGLSLVNADDGVEGKAVTVSGWTALVVDSEEVLCHFVEELRQMWRRSSLRVNENKSKVMKCTKGSWW